MVSRAYNTSARIMVRAEAAELLLLPVTVVTAAMVFVAAAEAAEVLLEAVLPLVTVVMAATVLPLLLHSFKYNERRSA